MRTKIKILSFLTLLVLALAGIMPTYAQGNVSTRPTCDWLMSAAGAPFMPQGLTITSDVREQDCMWILTHQGQKPYSLMGTSFLAKDASDKPYSFTNNGAPALLTYVWGADGSLWPAAFPVPTQRHFYSLAFTISEGTYAFNGVECWLKIDANRDGVFDGPAVAWPANDPNSFDPQTIVGRGNGLTFTVQTADHGQAWALATCNEGGTTNGQYDGSSVGFTITSNVVTSAAPAAVSTAVATAAANVSAGTWPADLNITITDNTTKSNVGFYPDGNFFVVTADKITLTPAELVLVAAGNYTIWVVGTGMHVNFVCGAQKWDAAKGAGYCPANTPLANVTFEVTK